MTTMNDFKIEKILGKGSFSTVFLVTRKADNQIYALKSVYMDKLKKKEQENSVNEVRILASINHPNVIGYKEAFWDDFAKTLNIVMEYASDGDLQTKIQEMKKSNGFFNENIIWLFSIQMIEGLKALHDKKIMHRDLKSANIFLKKNMCKIGDMNVSKVIKDKLLLTQTGTPYYASPEVWNDKPYSYKSDLWSIGCVIYEMCALKPPFKGKNLDELYENVCKGKVDRINFVYSENLWKMILMLLQVDVDKRCNCDQFLNSKLIVDKIKEMKECNDVYKELEDNKSFCDGVLLNTIKFKDLREIKGQLPTKKNYDCGNSRSNKILYGENNNINDRNDEHVSYSNTNSNKNIIKAVYNNDNKKNLNYKSIKNSAKNDVKNDLLNNFIGDLNIGLNQNMNNRNSLKNERYGSIKQFQIELENCKKERNLKINRDKEREIERNKIRERIKEYENKLKLREEAKNKKKEKTNKMNNDLYRYKYENNNNEKINNNYNDINKKYLNIINNFCKNLTSNITNNLNNYSQKNKNDNLNNNINNNINNNNINNINNINNKNNNIYNNNIYNKIQPHKYNNSNNKKKQISSARINNIYESIHHPNIKISGSIDRLITDNDLKTQISKKKPTPISNFIERSKTPSAFYTKLYNKPNLSKRRDNENLNNNILKFRKELSQVNNNCLTSISKCNIFNKYVRNNKNLQINISNNNADSKNNIPVNNYRNNTYSYVSNSLNKRVIKKIATYEKKHKTKLQEPLRSSSIIPSKRFIDLNQQLKNNLEKKNLSHQLEKYFIFNNRNIEKGNNASSNIKNYLNNKPKIIIENHINNKYSYENKKIEKNNSHLNIINNISEKYSAIKTAKKINIRSNSYKSNNHGKNYIARKRDINYYYNRGRDLTEPDLKLISNPMRIKDVKSDANKKLNFSLFNNGINYLNQNSFLHDNTKNTLGNNKTNKINKQYYTNVQNTQNTQQIFNNFYTINSNNFPVKVINFFNNK